MAETTHGTVYLFGIDGTVVNAKVQSEKIVKTDKINAEVKDEKGRLVAIRCDDQTDQLDLELIVESAYTLPTVAALFAYDNVNYRVVSVGRDRTNTEHAKVPISAVKDEYLTLV